MCIIRLSCNNRGQIYKRLEVFRVDLGISQEIGQLPLRRHRQTQTKQESTTSPRNLKIHNNSTFNIMSLNSMEYTTNFCTKITDFRGFDSSIVLMLRGGIPRPIGKFPESFSQAILIGVILVGRLGVTESTRGQPASQQPLTAIIRFVMMHVHYHYC